MQPERKTVISGKLVEEFCWTGKLVTYIDHQRTDESYDGAVQRLN